MDQPKYIGFPVLELSKLYIYETDYEELEHYLGEKKYNYTIWILIASY